MNDTLKIEKNFSLTHKFEQTTGCLMYNATCSYTGEIATKIKDAGFFASAWAIGQRDYDEYERLISWGVNEFTEDFHCSMGLNY